MKSIKLAFLFFAILATVVAPFVWFVGVAGYACCGADQSHVDRANMVQLFILLTLAVLWLGFIIFAIYDVPKRQNHGKKKQKTKNNRRG